MSEILDRVFGYGEQVEGEFLESLLDFQYGIATEAVVHLATRTTEALEETSDTQVQVDDCYTD